MSENEYLAHHGVKGQKWGVRRYQNADGSLTPEGKERYHKQINREARKAKAAITGVGAYGGGVIGAMASGIAKTAAFAGYVTPIAGLSTPAIVAGSAFVGAVGAAALTYKDINFNRDEQHMYVESGKYFMSRTLDVNLKK